MGGRLDGAAVMFLAMPFFGGFSTRLIVPLPGGSVSDFLFPPQVASAAWRFNSDGRVDSGEHNVFTYRHDWHQDVGSGIGNDFWVRATLTAGDPLTGGVPVDTWVRLDSPVVFSRSSPAGGGTANSTIRVEISPFSGGPAVTSGSYLLFASSEN